MPALSDVLSARQIEQNSGNYTYMHINSLLPNTGIT